MRVTDFSIGDTYYFTAHLAFRSDEKFTVLFIGEDYLKVQSNLSRWIDCPLIVPMEALVVYQDFGIKFTKLTEGDKANLRHVIQRAEQVSKGKTGAVNFDELIEQGEVIDSADLVTA